MMSKTIEDLFYYLATYIPLLPFLVFGTLFFLSIHHKKNKILRTISIYALLEFATNYFTQATSMHSTLLIYSLFTLLEYWSFAIAFFLMIRSPLGKKVITGLSFGFSAFWTCYRIYGPENILDSIPIGVSSILILIYAFYFFYEELENVTEGVIYGKYTFWITSGILVYLAGNFFLYVFANQVDTKTRNIFWMFGNLCAILKNVFFLVSIIIYRNKPLFSSKYSPKHKLV